MMTRLTLIFALLAAGPALAEGDAYPAYPSYDFTSFQDTDFVVIIAFTVFLAILFYFNVPSLLMGMLDRRSAQIRADLDEARALREEAQTILAGYERKQREVADQSERIVAAARADAAAAAEAAKAELQESIARRLQAAEDQIANAENKAVKEVRDRAIEVAVAAAADVLAAQTSAADANKLIDASISEVERRLN